MEPEAVWALVEEGARALHGLHASGESHGDLRPETMGYTQEGTLRIWSRTGNSVPWPVWREELDLPTPFLTPEVWLLGGAPPMRQDIYGLCACSWYCLTGQPPAAAGGAEAFRPEGRRQRQLAHALERGLVPQRPGTAAELLDILHAPPPRNPVWARPTRGRGPKAIAPIHCITAFLALSLVLTGSVLWQRATAPEPEPTWRPPNLLEGLTQGQRALMIQGSFTSGELSYEFPVYGIRQVTVTGYVGTGTEVIRLPDSLPYDPTYFPADCQVYGGRSTEIRQAGGETALERQLREALAGEEG